MLTDEHCYGDGMHKICKMHLGRLSLRYYTRHTKEEYCGFTHIIALPRQVSTFSSFVLSLGLISVAVAESTLLEKAL